MIVSDVNYGYQSLLGTDASAAWLDFGWALAVIAHGLAGIWQATSKPSGATPITSPISSPRLNTWSTYLPYGALVVYFLLKQSHHHGEAVDAVWLTWSDGLIIGLVLLRQIVKLHENTLLFAQVRRQAETVGQINQELQLEISERMQAEAQLAHDAVHDASTGLPNRGSSPTACIMPLNWPNVGKGIALPCCFWT
jgi:hypothetical protein